MKGVLYSISLWVFGSRKDISLVFTYKNSWFSRNFCRNYIFSFYLQKIPGFRDSRTVRYGLNGSNEKRTGVGVRLLSFHFDTNTPLPRSPTTDSTRSVTSRGRCTTDYWVLRRTTFPFSQPTFDSFSSLRGL